MEVQSVTVIHQNDRKVTFDFVQAKKMILKDTKTEK